MNIEVIIPETMSKELSAHCREKLVVLEKLLSRASLPISVEFSHQSTGVNGNAYHTVLLSVKTVHCKKKAEASGSDEKKLIDEVVDKVYKALLVEQKSCGCITKCTCDDELLCGCGVNSDCGCEPGDTHCDCW